MDGGFFANGSNRNGSGDRARKLEIGQRQFVGPAGPTCIDFGGSGANPIAVDVESAQQPSLVRSGAGLNLHERVGRDEERQLQRGIVSPESNRPTRRVISAARIGKIQRQGDECL